MLLAFLFIVIIDVRIAAGDLCLSLWGGDGEDEGEGESVPPSSSPFFLLAATAVSLRLVALQIDAADEEDDEEELGL